MPLTRADAMIASLLSAPTQAPLTTAAPNTAGSESASSDSSAGSSLPIIAAAAGGGVVLIIVIVVVVIVRSRRKPRASQDPSQRTVVAFENPMYDSAPKQAAEAESVYDNNADGPNASAGLYDEPAFAAKSDKENPLYESTEKLDNHGDDAPVLRANDGYGNFDASAEVAQPDAGYLDVTDN